MQLFVFLLLLAFVVCALAQYPYYYGSHYYGAYPYNYAHSYYNPGYYYWK